MKNKIVVFIVIFFASKFALASCGSLPGQPALLNEPQLNLTQLEILEPQFEVYLESLESYQACIDVESGSIDPDTEDYQAIYQDWSLLREAAEEQKLLAIDRYNTHIETVDTQLSEEASTQSQ